MKYFVTFSLKKNRTFFRSEKAGSGNAVISGIEGKMDKDSIREIEEQLCDETGADSCVILFFAPLEG